MPQLASHIETVPTSGIRAVYELAIQLDDVIMLSLGEPDAPLAPHIAAAAKAAWDANETRYTANGGIPMLREAIVAKLARDNALDVDLEQVWVTVGASQAINQALTLLLESGDEVLIPDPGYPTFTMNARMLDARPVPYSLLPEDGFMPDLAQLERLVSERTKVIIVNSPSNPLGVVFPRQTLEGILEFARRHDLWVVSDEVYEAFHHGAKHVSIASLDEDDRVFTAFSLSKTYAMTGARVGYLVVPRGMSAIMRSVQEATISCVAAPEQRAALAAIAGDQAHVADAARHYRANLDLATRLLDERGLRYHRPQGSFYLWIDVSHASEGDVAAWAMAFLVEQRVAVAPGSAFGRSGEGWIRVCLAATADDLVDGLGRLPTP